jgi:hypothetical protein
MKKLSFTFFILILAILIFIIFANPAKNLIIIWNDWEVITNLSAITLLLLVYTSLIFLITYFYYYIITLREKLNHSKEIKKLNKGINILNDLSNDIDKNEMQGTHEKIKKAKFLIGDSKIINLIESIISYRDSNNN